MPRFRLRRVLQGITLMLLYHWLVGIPLLANVTNALSWSAKAKQAVLSKSDVDTNVWDATKPWKKRIVAIGDLHGDLANALSVLRSASLVDHQGQWIGKTATLVQTGDIVDRGKDTIALYALMDNLRAQARKDGGEVISLLGNHEFMNAMGDWRYVTKEDIATFGGEANRRRVMSSGWIGQTWKHNYTVSARVPYAPSPLDDESDVSDLASSSLIAVHGGIHPTWANISRVNAVGDSLLARCVDNGISKVTSLPRDTPDEEKSFYDANGPVWFRGYATDSEEQMCDMADWVLEKTKAKRMLMGHTPNFKGIVSRCRGKVIIIDTGISKAYGGVLSALEIVYTLAPTSGAEGDLAGGSKKGGVALSTKMTEKEVVTAIYGDNREVLVKRERLVDVPLR